MVHESERPIGVLRPALDQVAPESAAFLDRRGGTGFDCRIPAVFPGHDHQQRSAAAGERPQAIGAVRPVPDPSHQADDDEARAGQRLLDIEIDRKRMGELHQIGETQARRPAGPRGRRRKGRELAVGRRQEHDLAGRLVEVDGDVAVVDARGVAGEKMHG